MILFVLTQKDIIKLIKARQVARGGSGPATSGGGCGCVRIATNARGLRFLAMLAEG